MQQILSETKQVIEIGFAPRAKSDGRHFGLGAQTHTPLVEFFGPTKDDTLPVMNSLKGCDFFSGGK